MGTKRPSCTLFDTLANINTSDRKLQPGGKVSRDPSPRPAMTAQSERERDGNHEEDWRRERQMEKMRDKARYNDIDPRERYYERDRAPAPWPRDGEREWGERERKKEDDRSRNGRPLSNMENDFERAVEKMKKGDTFPRIRKHSNDRGRRGTATTEMEKERGERRQRDWPKRVDTDDWERDRYRMRDRDEMIRSKAREQGQTTGRRPVEDEKPRQKERYQEYDVDFQDRRRDIDDTRDKKERDAMRKREKPRPDIGKREARVPSPHGRRDREIYTEREERKKAQRREGQRDTRSEGDNDERDIMRERRSEEPQCHYSRSQGGDRVKTKRERDRDRQGYRDEDRQRYRDRDRDRDREVDQSKRRELEKERERHREGNRRASRDGDREGERWKENTRDVKDDRRGYDRYRESKQERGREAKEREVDPRWDDSTGRASRSRNETTSRVQPRAQSSGEWSTTESDRDTDEQRNPKRAAERNQTEHKRSERQERDRGVTPGGVPEQRRMWLEPQRGKNSKEDFVDRERHRRERSMESRAECGRDGQRVKEEPDECYLDQSSHRQRHGGRNEYRGDTGRETSVDREEVGEGWGERAKRGKEHLSDSDGGIEESRSREVEGDKLTDNIEESDGEEEVGSDNLARSESEGGSETGGKEDRDRVMSGEDGFVTVSSGGDEDYEDCQEFWEGGVAYDDLSPGSYKGHEVDEREEWTMGKDEMVDEDGQGREKQPKYIFCVVGQTLPRSKTSKKSPSQVAEAKREEEDDLTLKRTTWEPQDDWHPTLSRNDEYPMINDHETESKSGYNSSTEERTSMEETEVDIKLQDLETNEGMMYQREHLYIEKGTINRDSQTERLLIEWREKNKDLERDSEQSLPVPENPYDEVCSQVDLEQIKPILARLDTAAMSPEQVEAIRIRLSGAWSMSEEPKRHSQAPHLKWAKTVVREILGNSEDQTLDECNEEVQGDQGVYQAEAAIRDDEQQVEDSQETEEVPGVKLRLDEQQSDPELEEEEPLEMEGLRGMGQSPTAMHADQLTAMHGDTHTCTHADTLADTEGKGDHSMDKESDPFGQLQTEKAEIKVEISESRGDDVRLSEEVETSSREKEVEMYLSVSNTLYKPNSCPILSYDTECDLNTSIEGEGQDVLEGMVEIEEKRQGKVYEEMSSAGELEAVREEERTEIVSGEVAEMKMKGGTLMSSCSFRDLGPEARLRRRGIRITTERRDAEHIEEEGVGRDRRTRIFPSTDDEDSRSKSWGEVELRNVLDTIERRKRNSKYFNAAQLYQQYSEAAQNSEILRQARSDVILVSEDTAPSPAPSPPPARRPLPPLPPLPTVWRKQPLSQTGSISSVQSLPLPEPPKSEGRPSSPRLSISLTQSSTLWRELPAVRNSTELEVLTEDQRRLQEVRFEVVTSEASYCRSLDIVVQHFVKSKQLGALLTTQDRNWLFSRLADVRAISHSFLSKLEERVESNIISFTVCDIIARHCQRFKMVYVPYLTNQSYQDATYQRLMNENPGFKRIVEKLERSPVCQRLPLRSFLVLPFQRITRLKLLVQNIVKRTTPGTVEATQAIKSLKLLEKLIQESNDSITQMKSIESLVSLSAKVDFECRTLPLISQSRRMVREGPVTELIDFSLKDTERNIYLHLFNDYLLLSLQKEGGRFTVIDHSPVSDLRAENCRVKLHSLQKNLFRLHMSTKALLLRTDTQSDKLRWISALSRPHAEIDFSAAQDFPQMQCIRASVSQQPDELSLEKADIILVHQHSSDNWVEGTRLSDRHRGWVPESHLETISNPRVRQRNLSDALKLTTATAAI